MTMLRGNILVEDGRWAERHRPVHFLAFAGATMSKPARVQADAVAIGTAEFEYERRSAIGAEHRMQS